MKTYRFVLLFAGLFVWLGCTNVLYAQTDDAMTDKLQTKNSLYLELGGNALVYSINYDRVLTDAFSARIGIGFYSLDDDFGDTASLTGIPITAHYLLGKGNSRLELGAGLVVLTGKADLGGVSTSDATVLGTGVFAYRFQKPDGGVFFKAGFTPLFQGGTFIPWFGISIGYTL